MGVAAVELHHEGLPGFMVCWSLVILIPSTLKREISISPHDITLNPYCIKNHLRERKLDFGVGNSFPPLCTVGTHNEIATSQHLHPNKIQNMYIKLCKNVL